LHFEAIVSRKLYYDYALPEAFGYFSLDVLGRKELSKEAFGSAHLYPLSGTLEIEPEFDHGKASAEIVRVRRGPLREAGG